MDPPAHEEVDDPCIVILAEDDPRPNPHREKSAVIIVRAAITQISKNGTYPFSATQRVLCYEYYRKSGGFVAARPH